MTPTGTGVSEVCELFKALGSEARLRIVRALRGRGLCVGGLAARLDMSPSAVSQHLHVLRRAGLVVSDKRANFVHYRLSPDAARKCEAAVRQILAEPEEQQ